MKTKLSYEVLNYVLHNKCANTFDCQCNMFSRIGILCRHIFKILLNDGVEKIPTAYISRRWIRALIPVQIQAAKARYGEIDVEHLRKRWKKISDQNVCVGFVKNMCTTTLEIVPIEEVINMNVKTVNVNDITIMLHIIQYLNHIGL
ncbi:hypothetical protein OSB04_016630 [Centaurea solstitialis]|uniref:SWIM-type domain-containing protein n=1 Tax=Centaurea solstitialis TaxID=347529 RepID=A0AA38T1B7_9ASTR|nr:hypothetical protein OSB04_016630 [Centaurea solstitialis]